MTLTQESGNSMTGRASARIQDGWTIWQSNNPRRLTVSFPYQYNKSVWSLWLNLVRSVPDRKFDGTSKTWNIPTKELSKVVAALRHHKIPYEVIGEAIAASAEAQVELEDKLISLKFEDVSPFPIDGLSTTPYPYQYTGIQFLSQAKNCILADDMGCGKTIQALAASLLIEAQSVLIVCPSSLKWNWEREVQKHTNESCIIIHGSAKKRANQWDSENRFFICSYDTIPHDEGILARKKFDLIIADEATRVKSHRAKRTKALKAIDSTYRFALTGTPIENKLEELHSIADWCQPGILGSLWYFLERYARKDFFGNVVGYKKEGIPEIRRIVAPYILRREKEDVLPQLPPKLPPENRKVEFSTAERREYRALAKETLELVLADLSNSLVRVLRAKQFTSSPLLLGYASEGPKIRELETILDEGEGHKFLVFSDFAQLINLLGPRFNAPILTGDVKQEDRQPIIDEFNANPNQRVLFSSGVASHGVEITGADVVVHLDTPWNPAVKEQREDRVHRPGQTRPVNIIRLMVLSTIDDRIDKVIAEKMNLRNLILDDIDYEQQKKSFSKSDWEKILLGDE